MKDVRIFNEDAMEVTIVRKEGACEPSLKVNIFTAAFTTTLARFKLYESLEKLDQQVLYYDADSVIYKWAPGLPDIPTGLYLGEMSDELEGDSITLFGSAGPKSYCYATKSGDKECKNKGTKSSDKINQNLNCDSMINHIKLELSEPQEARRTMKIEINNHFVLDSTTKSVKLEDVVKNFGVVWDKRVVDRSTGKTYPFGYVRIGK